MTFCGKVQFCILYNAIHFSLSHTEGINTTLRTTLTPTTPTTPTRKTAATTSTPTEHRPAATTALFTPSLNTGKKKDPNKKDRKKKHKGKMKQN